MRTKATVLIVVILGLGACRKHAASVPAAPAARVVADAGGGVAGRLRIPPEAERAEAERDTRATIERWVDAQNQGDFAAYAALYDQGHFRGLKRTKGGKATRSDWPGWRADREKMFDKGRMTVAVEELAIETWLHKGSTLRPGICEARFVQRWRNPRYADHGVKVLQFFRTKSGMAILYEDMLTSAPGWKSELGVDAGGAFVLGDDVAVPKSEEEAMALWRKLGITQGTVDAATTELVGWDGAGIMAEALLRHGSFVCKRFVEYGECGQSETQWEIVPPETGWTDPCVQREAAVWAILSLSKQRLAALGDVLVGLAGMKPPENRIPETIATRLEEMPESLRLRVVSAMLASRCDKHECELTDPRELVGELSAKSRIALYQDKGRVVPAREAAIAGVDLSRNPELLVEVYGDGSLAPELRENLWPTLLTQKPAVIERALRLAADDERCGFAMAAIERLAGRGKKELLPSAGEDDPARVVCLLLNASDKVWAEREFRKLLPKRGKITFTEERQDEMDGEGGKTKTSEKEIPVREVNLGSLPEGLREHAGTVETSSFGLEKAYLLFDADGLLSDVYKSVWMGCPC
jgi:hypothetical protein